jgi:hypothetical protein
MKKVVKEYDTNSGLVKLIAEIRKERVPMELNSEKKIERTKLILSANIKDYKSEQWLGVSGIYSLRSISDYKYARKKFDTTLIQKIRKLMKLSNKGLGQEVAEIKDGNKGMVRLYARDFWGDSVSVRMFCRDLYSENVKKVFFVTTHQKLGEKEKELPIFEVNNVSTFDNYVKAKSSMLDRVSKYLQLDRVNS